MRRSVERLMPPAVAFAVTAPFFINICGWLFQCGCHSLWNGASRACNVHAADMHHCPFCTMGPAGYAFMGFVVAAPQLLALRYQKGSSAARAVTSIVLFVLTIIAGGLVVGWAHGYWF